MMVSIVRAGREIGEWPEEQVRDFYRAGQLFGDDLFWHEGMADWQPLRSLVKPTVPSQGVASIKDGTHLIPLAVPPPLPQAPLARKSGRDWKKEGRGFLRLLSGILIYFLVYWGTRLYLGPGHEIMSDFFYAAVVGFLCGLIPLVIAKKMGLPCQRYFLICGASGAIGGLILTVPLCIGLVIFLCMKKKVTS